MTVTKGIQRGHLVAILANPPTHTSVITARRVALASEVLQYQSFEIANFFPLASKSVLDISFLGQHPGPWLEGRKLLQSAMERADGVLLGYGCQGPSGDARTHHRAQIDWVTSIIQAQDLPTWTLGNRPHHPSRWQRYTSRHFPQLPFVDAVSRSIKRYNF